MTSDLGGYLRSGILAVPGTDSTADIVTAETALVVPVEAPS